MSANSIPHGAAWDAGNQPTMLEAALAYARLGIAVFPCHTPNGTSGACSCGMAHCSRCGKHPRIGGGFHSATKDERQIREWWKQWPDANIGAATGMVSGFIVLDADGAAGIEELRPHLDDIKASVTSGGGGTHAYFAHPEYEVRNHEKKLGKWPFQACDFRGDGGYVLLPPSLHKSGACYNWDGEFPDGNWPAVPVWLAEALQAAKREDDTTADDHSTHKGKKATSQLWSTKAAEAILEKYTKLVKENGQPRNRTGFDMAQQLHDARVPKVNAVPYMRDYQTAVQDWFQDRDPYTWDEARKSLDSAYSEEPREPAFGAGKQGDPPDGGGIWSASQYVGAYADALRYVAVHKRWYCYNGKWWDVARQQEHIRKGQELVQRMYSALPDDSGKRRERLKLITKLDTAAGIHSMVDLASARAEMSALPEHLDRYPFQAVVDNGVLDLRTGILLPHNSDALHTRRLGPSSKEASYALPYDPTAMCPNWLAFLHRIMLGRQADIDFVQRAFGYTLTGDTREQCWFLLTGGGNNGKSTLIRVLKALLGTYADVVPIESLLSNKADAIKVDIAKLDGIRCAITGENEQERKLAEALIKQIVGGDDYSARFLYGQPFTFRPQFKLWMHTNYRPKIRGQDYGTWRKIKNLPFDYTIPEAERDKYFYETYLEPELPGILAWAVQGCLAWQRDNDLGETESMRKARDDYRAESDITLEYLQDAVVAEEGWYVVSKSLYEDYVKWCKQRNERADTPNMFGKRVKRAYGVESVNQRIGARPATATAPGQPGRPAKVYLGLRTMDYLIDGGRLVSPTGD